MQEVCKLIDCFKLSNLYFRCMIHSRLMCIICFSQKVHRLNKLTLFAAQAAG